MTLNVQRRRDRKRSRHTRVWLDGVEVSDRCFYADVRRGVVRLCLYEPNTKGRRYMIREPNSDRIATEERRGHVRWGHK